MVPMREFGAVAARAYCRHNVTSDSALRTAFGLRLLFDPSFVRVALALVLGIAVVARLAQFLVFSTQAQWGYDFSAYLWAGGDVLAGRSPYEAFQLEGTYSPQSQGLYIYPPSFAVAVAPMAAIFDEYRVANWLWAAVGAAILGRSSWLSLGGSGWSRAGMSHCFCWLRSLSHRQSASS